MRAAGPVHQPWWCAALLLLASSNGRAESEPGKEPVRAHIDVTTNAQASTCVRLRTISRRTEANLHRPVFTRNTDAGDVTVKLDVVEGTPSTATLALSESATGASLGHRRLEAETCAELEASVVLTLTLMLDFERAEMTAKKDAAAALAATSEENPSGSPPPTTSSTNATPAPSAPATTPEPATTTTTKLQATPAPSTQPPADRAPAIEESNDSTWTWDATAEGRSGWGWAPRTELGLGAAVGASSERFRAELGVGFWPTQTFPKLGGELALSRRNVHLALSPWGLKRGHWLLRVGALASLEQTRSEGSGYASNQSADTLSGDVGVVGAIDYSLTRVLFARFGVQVTAPVRGADYVVSAPDAPRAAFSVAPVTAGLLLGIGFKSP